MNDVILTRDDLLAFIDKVNSKETELKDWLNFLKFLDDYLKNRGLQNILSDYLERETSSTISLCYDAIRRVCEDPGLYNPPAELFQTQDHFEMILRLYDTSGDIIAKMITKQTSGLNKDLRLLRSHIQSILGKFATLLAILALPSFDTEADVKNMPKSNAHPIDINAALGMEVFKVTKIN